MLSVSTIGTNELQRGQRRTRHARLTIFQFPQSERMSCNSCLWICCCSVGTRLSVSTIGTNELQHVRAVERGRVLCLSVSTIGTNELQRSWFIFGDADFGNFQFPQSERMSCNSCFLLHLLFVYVLSVSTIGTNELQRVVWFDARR